MSVYLERGLGSVRPRSAGLSVRRARGVVAVQVAVVVVVLLGFGALAVDIGFIYNSKGEMQAAVDSGALAGASAVYEGGNAYVARAREYVGMHEVAFERVVEGANIRVGVTVGFWDGSARNFVPATGDEGVTPNAVRVDAERTSVDLFFARILGHDTTDIEREAVALEDSGRCRGIWGVEGISGNGNIYTDSYDSSAGAYGGDNVHANGDICSDQGIDLSGSVDVYGDAMYGAGFDLVTDGHPQVWGVVAEQCCETQPPPADFAEAEFVNDNAFIGLTDRGRDPFSGTQWDFVVTGNDNLTLNGGTYYMTSALVDGRATVTITAPTTFYIVGPAEFTGDGVVNVSQKPGDLVIYSSGPTMTVSGTAGFYGVVVAPQADIQLLGTGEYFGLLLGRTLDVQGNSTIHVDESALATIFSDEGKTPGLVR